MKCPLVTDGAHFKSIFCVFDKFLMYTMTQIYSSRNDSIIELKEDNIKLVMIILLI